MFKKIVIIIASIVFIITFYFGFQIGTSIWEGFTPKSTIESTK